MLVDHDDLLAPGRSERSPQPSSRSRRSTTCTPTRTRSTQTATLRRIPQAGLVARAAARPDVHRPPSVLRTELVRRSAGSAPASTARRTTTWCCGSPSRPARSCTCRRCSTTGGWCRVRGGRRQCQAVRLGGRAAGRAAAPGTARIRGGAESRTAAGYLPVVRARPIPDAGQRDHPDPGRLGPGLGPAALLRRRGGPLARDGGPRELEIVIVLRRADAAAVLDRAAGDRRRPLCSCRSTNRSTSARSATSGSWPPRARWSLLLNDDMEVDHRRLRSSNWSRRWPSPTSA